MSIYGLFDAGHKHAERRKSHSAHAQALKLWYDLNRYKPPFKITMYHSADNSHVKEIKQIKLKLSPFQLNIHV